MQETQGSKKIASRFVRKKTLRTTLQEVSQQMYVRNKELADTNRMLSLLRAIDSLALESHDSVKLICQQVTNAVAESTEYPFVGLFTRETARGDEFGLFGLSGIGRNGKSVSTIFHNTLYIPEDSWLLKPEMLGATLDTEDLATEEVAHELGCTLHEFKALEMQLPLKSLYTVKLSVRQRLVGILVVGFLGPSSAISDSDRGLLDRLGSSIGVALDNKLLFEENRRVLMQLKRSNGKLKILDEAKDEFISMASHQLRTPLTTVKGYLSMVLEGDVGEVAPAQKKVLEKAYDSSQRMVYLIGDFLNVSRLQTGKFVMERLPSSLAKVIDEEISQLQASANSRKITLSYQAPTAFPVLVVDENKLRQVMMNFIDNAIYYSKPDTRIDISLIRRKDEIVFKVVDHGIGVPVDERAQLFTKFYRASNAKKQRPDGTGIGLFMAKKVIVAHGGSVIFETKEGQGSTFGFRLPLEANLQKLEKPADKS